jgi:hypothetical protein
MLQASPQSGGVMDQQHKGISNRQSAEEEARDRKEHPPVDTGSPPPTDAGDRRGEVSGSVDAANPEGGRRIRQGAQALRRRRQAFGEMLELGLNTVRG